MKKFDVNDTPNLENAARLSWNNPAQIVAAVDVRPGDRVAEIGCGSGWFTFEIERAVRPRGMVFALDMQPAMLQILRARRDWERILTLPCGENEFELDDGEVDIVFHANVLHECADAARHLGEVRRVLKNDGRLIVIEWHWADEESQPGPSNTVRIPVDDARPLIENAGFSIDDVSDVGPYHYALQAKRSDN